MFAVSVGKRIHRYVARKGTDMRRQNLNAVDAIADREAAERGDLLIVGVRPATGTRVRTDVLDSITSMIGMVPDAVLHLSVGRAADGVT